MLLCEKCFTIYRSIVYDLGDLHHFSIHCRFSTFAYTRQCFGMILLFLLLIKGIIQVRYIERAASFLNKHLAFFFIPFAVGLMNYGGLIKTSGAQLLIMIAGSSILGLLITGGLTQYLSRKVGVKREQSNSH